jgi:uncharacterized protein (TIGR03437 family)
MGRSSWCRTTCVAFLFSVALVAASHAQTFATVTTFHGYDGANPGALTLAGNGSFYGVTEFGGSNDDGTVFRISSGGVLETLTVFGPATSLANRSLPGGLIQAIDGNFYGTTSRDGASGKGTVFKITPGGALTTLHSFAGPDGSYPGLSNQGADGNFYGITGGGACGGGTVFRMTPDGTLTTLHSFCGADGSLPGGLVQATDGNFYGTTFNGGANPQRNGAAYLNNTGTIYRMTPDGTLTTLHSFAGPDGGAPLGLIQARDGTFYGTTQFGGEGEVYGGVTCNCGTVFKVTAAGALTVLHSFAVSDGAGPGALFHAADGDFYGTTETGALRGNGTIFKITAGGAFTTLHSFSSDGFGEPGGLVQSGDGVLYGTTYRGGTDYQGTVFSLSLAPTASPAPSIASGGIVPIYSSSTTIQPGEWVSIYGTNLATVTTSWNGDFPTSLGGTSVTINGKAAYLSLVSAGQINLQAPDDTATGAVPVVVTTAGGRSTSTVTLAQFGPSFSLLDAKHVAGVILRSDGSGAYGGGTYDIIGPNGTSFGYRTVPAKAGDTIGLFAVGLGPFSPAVPAGEVFSGAALTTNPVRLLINNVSVVPGFAGLSSAGLYQINLTVPAGVGTGDVRSWQ